MTKRIQNITKQGECLKIYKQSLWLNMMTQYVGIHDMQDFDILDTYFYW